MKAVVCALLFATLLGCAVAETKVVTLTGDNFYEVVKNNDVVLVEFFAPWCGHCKSLAPEYEEAAGKLEGKVVLGAVDATEEKALATKYEIQGFPTLKIFRGGDLESPADYNGGRQAADIVSYMEKQAGPAFATLADKDAVNDFISEHDKIALGVFKGDSELRTAFRAAASAMRDTMFFGETEASDLKYAEGVWLVKDNGNDELQFPGGDEDMKAWIKVNKVPLLDAIGPDNYMDYMDAGLPIAWLCIKPSDEAASEAAKNVVRGVAAEFKGKVSFVTLDGEEYSQQVETLGLSGEVYPSLALLNETVHYSYDETKQINPADLTAFINDYFAGKLVPSIRSEKEPEDNNGPVKIVVGSTFESIVQDKERDVLVEFYAPWCGHCKQLAPIYDQLGKIFSGNDKIVIAKMDATANEAPPQFEVEGFPTLMYFKAGEDQGSPIKYDGGRELEDFIEFIQSNSDFDTDVDITGNNALSFLDNDMKSFRSLVEKLIAEKKDLAGQLSKAKAIIKELDAKRLDEVHADAASSGKDEL